jgi:hypothetical protein
LDLWESDPVNSTKHPTHLLFSNSWKNQNQKPKL